MMPLSEVCLISTCEGDVWVIVTLPPATVPFFGPACAAPTIRADADTPANRPAIRPRRALQRLGSATHAARVPTRRPGAERPERRWRAMRRADTMGGGSEHALLHP